MSDTLTEDNNRADLWSKKDVEIGTYLIIGTDRQAIAENYQTDTYLSL